jgi:hypothetical protein
MVNGIKKVFPIATFAKLFLRPKMMIDDVDLYHV